MSFRVRFTDEARGDLERLFGFLLDRSGGDPALAGRALAAIGTGLAFLAETPFTCRKATLRDPLLRELLVPFGHSGYVALFEIEDASTVTVLAVRHQREEDRY